ncbi:MAG TPA: hypothetical protein VI259_00065, partial [Gemmatimonadaceae bacterium]
GRARPARTTVTIINADTCENLVTAVSDGEGEWNFRITLTTAPCRIQAKAGGLSSAVRTVEGTPRSCRTGDGEEEDGHDGGRD